MEDPRPKIIDPMPGEPLTIRTPPIDSVLRVLDAHNGPIPIIDIKADGRCYWHGKWVTTDAEFVGLCKALIKHVYPNLQTEGTDPDGRC